MRKGGSYLALGDSITWAVASGASKGTDFYAWKIRNAIRSNYGACQFINKGIGGSTSAEAVQNIPWIFGNEADLITIGLGMNDSQSRCGDC